MSAFLRLINATMLSLGKQNSQITNLAIKFINENRASFTGVLKKYTNELSLNTPSAPLVDEIVDNFTLLAQLCDFLNVRVCLTLLIIVLTKSLQYDSVASPTKPSLGMFS